MYLDIAKNLYRTADAKTIAARHGLSYKSVSAAAFNLRKAGVEIPNGRRWEGETGRSALAIALKKLGKN